MASSIPNRQEIKQEEKAFVKSSQQAMQKVSKFLQDRLIHAVMACDNSQCVNKVTKNIDEVEFQMKRFMDTLSLGVQKCISIESNKGIKGYSKCFKMYDQQDEVARIVIFLPFNIQQNKLQQNNFKGQFSLKQTMQRAL